MTKDNTAKIIEKKTGDFGDFLVTDRNYLDKNPEWILVLSGKEKGEKLKILTIKNQNGKIIYEVDDTSFIEVGDKIRFTFR